MFLIGCKAIGIELVTTEYKESTVDFDVEIDVKEEVGIKYGFINTHAITKKYLKTVAKPSGKIIAIGKPLTKGKYTLIFSIKTEYYSKGAILKLVFSSSKGDRTIRYKVIS